MHCPRCAQKHTEYRERELRTIKALYGILGPDEYAAAMKRANAIPERPEEPTFKENYDIGMEPDDTFIVAYFGRCTKCSYSHTFNHKEDVPL